MKIGRWVYVAGLAFMVGCAGSSAKPGPSTPVDVSPPGDASGFSAQSAESQPSAASSMPAPVAPPMSNDAPSAPRSAPPAAAPASPPPPMVSPPSGARSAPSPRADVHVDARAEKAPSQRPGLGTEWGETRVSRVHDVAFERADDRPFAIATLHYDDRRGVDALVALHARTASFYEVSAASNGAITVSLRDAHGHPLEARRVGDRTYVVGHAGERYTIVLSNHTGHRIEAVATVDGLDVINGRPGNLDNRGYMLEPFSSLEIDGFRRSQDAVAAFRFGRVADSYAAQTGSARDVGVIGVALFDEAGDRFEREDEARLRDTANPFPADDRFARPPR